MSDDFLLTSAVGLLIGIAIGTVTGCVMLHIYLERQHKQDMAEIEAQIKEGRRE